MSFTQDVADTVFGAMGSVGITGACLITRSDSGTYDLSTRTWSGQVSETSPAAVPCVVELPFSQQSEQFDVQNLRTQYYEVTVQASQLAGYVPKVGDKIVVAGDSQTYTVRGSGRLSPTGVPGDAGIYTLQISK